MSALGEKTFMLLLTDTDSVEVIARDGLDAKVLPTVAFREVYLWVMEYYRQSRTAPTVAVLHERFGSDRFADAGIPDIGEDVEESIEWAIDDLKQAFLLMEIGNFTRRLATEVSTSLPEDRIDTASGLSSTFAQLVQSLQPKTSHIDIRESGPDMLAEYELAVESKGEVRGMSFGLPQIDTHMGGVWDGELAIMGGPAGTGKSFFADYVAHHEWSRGRSTVLFTLENSILMTQMRLACQALKIDASALQTGDLDDEDHKALVEWCNDVLHTSDTPLHIINPMSALRTPQALVQTAKAYDAESLIIDQLTFMRSAEKQDARHREIGTILHDLKEMISTGRQTLPCLLMHQINREGIKAAAKTGRLDMTHMAEGSEVERTGDHVMSLYSSDEHRALGRMQIQTLKARRIKPEHWDLNWSPYSGVVQVLNTVSFEGVI